MARIHRRRATEPNKCAPDLSLRCEETRDPDFPSDWDAHWIKRNARWFGEGHETFCDQEHRRAWYGNRGLAFAPASELSLNTKSRLPVASIGGGLVFCAAAIRRSRSRLDGRPDDLGRAASDFVYIDRQ